jgi:hypothetical protein
MTMGDRYAPRHDGGEQAPRPGPVTPGRHAASRRICCGTMTGGRHDGACMIYAPDGTPRCGPDGGLLPFRGRGI